MFLKTAVSCMRNLFCQPPTRRCLTKMADVRVGGGGVRPTHFTCPLVVGCSIVRTLRPPFHYL